MMDQMLTTHENLDDQELDQALMHYRKGGEKKGVRRWQDENGHYTPEGREHYAEMYGWGKFKEIAKSAVKDHMDVATSKTNAEKAGAKAKMYEHKAERAKSTSDDDNASKAARFDKLAERYRKIEQRKIEKEEKWNRSDSEIKKDVESKMENFGKTMRDKADKRIAKFKAKQQEIKDIRKLADDELNKRIARLEKEKHLAELINEREAQEKSEFHKWASKLIKETTENMAKKALNMATDKLLEKYKIRMNNFNNNNNSNNKNNNNNKSDSSKSDSGSSGRFSKDEKSRIRSMANSGKSIADIARSLGVDESKVKGFMSSAGITIS